MFFGVGCTPKKRGTSFEIFLLLNYIIFNHYGSNDVLCFQFSQIRLRHHFVKVCDLPFRFFFRPI